MSSRAVCYKMSNWSAMATRIIFMQLLQPLLASNSQDFNLTQRANMGLRDLRCFCIFYEKCAINFDPYSLVLITFGLVFVKSNMISIIHLIVTNIQMWEAQFGPLCEFKILAVWGLSSNCYSLAECKAVTHIGMKALHYVFEPVINV